MSFQLLLIGIFTFLDALTYFFSPPGSFLRKWFSERRGRWWMKMWPPAQWALDSEKARVLTGIIQSALGLFLVFRAFTS